MADFKKDLKAVKSARRALDDKDRRLYEKKLAVQRAKGPNSLAAVSEDLRAAVDAAVAAERLLGKRIEKLHGTGDYRAIAKKLTADLPMVLFPVRVETRFVTVRERLELWLRVYPDDILVHSFEAELKPAEVEAGRAYWSALSAANREAGQDAEKEKQDAWTKLSRNGVQRALWIAKQTLPTNWQPGLDAEQLEFPDLGEGKTHDWTRAPQTRLLPDKFVVQIYRGDDLVRFKVGKSIPDTVFLGPDPFLAEEAFKRDGKRIESHESFAWITDFDQAVAKGLGFKIPVNRRMLNDGRIDRITVLGLLASADPEESQKLLEEHIRALRYSRKGFSFLPRGTPTNNTGKSESAYTKNYDDLPKGYYDGARPTPLSELTDSDGFAFAEALGIDPDVLNDVRHADKSERAEAKAMNEALYPATIGHFLEVLMEPAVPKAAQPKVKEFFTQHVSAGGPLPSIRVGDQPYGMLVTSDLGEWEEPSSDRFHSALSALLSLLQRRWDAMKDKDVAHVGKRGDSSKLLLEIMGLSPGSVTFKQRLAHLNDMHLSASNVSGVGDDASAKQDKIVAFLREAGYEHAGFPMVSALSFYGNQSFIRSDDLVDRKTPSDTRFLDELGPRKLNYIEWLAQVRSTKDLEGHALPGARPPRSILYLLLRHSLSLAMQKAALSVYLKSGVKFEAAAIEKSLYNFDRKVRDLTAWELLHGVPKKVGATSLNIAKPLGDHLLTTAPSRSTVADITSLRSALKRLAVMSTGRLHQGLIDHLDLCSYRLDAWQAGLVSRRLEAHRGRNRRGVRLGAYGWVENVRPEQKQAVPVADALAPGRSVPVFRSANNAGFVHTPSLNHATAAGVLHAGYRHHADAADPDAFAVNLSSERVRRGLQLYEGVQNNQPLEALLGYQFERGLHDLTTRNPAQNLNQYILDLREKFPIESASIPQAGNEAQETVPTYPVVDGLKLIRASAADFTAVGVSAVHLPLILQQQDRLRDSLDAVGDLLTSEAAYQMVQGKTDRTAGLLNSLKNIALAPDLEVNRTPRSTQLSINNKVCLSFAGLPAIPAHLGWAAAPTPRSRTEPGINSWLAGQIGDPKQIVCAVATVAEDGTTSNERTVRLSDLNVQPIDFVYSIGIDVKTGAKDLEELIYRHYAGTVELAPGARVAIRFDANTLGDDERSFAQVLPLATYLRLIITTGRPASAKDFEPRTREVRTTPDEQFGWDVGELQGRVSALRAELGDLLASVDSKEPNAQQPKTRENPGTLGEFFATYFEDGKPVELLEGLALSESSFDELLRFVRSAPLFGIKVGNSLGEDRTEPKAVASVLASAASVWQDANAKLSSADRRSAEAAASASKKVTVHRLVDAVKALLGDDFVVLPGFVLKKPADLRTSLEQGGARLLEFYSEKYDTTPELAVETWLQSLAPVRPAIRRLEQVRTIAEFHSGQELAFTPVQLPFKAEDHWLSVEFPEMDETTGEAISLENDTLSLCISGLVPQQVNGRQHMLVIDEWIEPIPSAKEVTGIAYNYNQPNSSAPNAVLVAVEPTGAKQWSWNVLTRILDDTLRRAKTRAVEPAHLLKDPVLDVLAPMTIASFDLHEANISLDFLATDDELVARMKQADFTLYKQL